MLSDDIENGDYKAVAREGFDNLVICQMKITEWL